MLPQQVRDFAIQTQRGVLTTFRRNGAAQMSIVSCGPYREGIAFTTTAGRAKLRNLQRNPQCSLLVSQENWWRYVVSILGLLVLGMKDTSLPESPPLSVRNCVYWILLRSSTLPAKGASTFWFLEPMRNRNFP